MIEKSCLLPTMNCTLWWQNPCGAAAGSKEEETTASEDAVSLLHCHVTYEPSRSIYIHTGNPWPSHAFTPTDDAMRRCPDRRGGLSLPC